MVIGGRELVRPSRRRSSCNCCLTCRLLLRRGCTPPERHGHILLGSSVEHGCALTCRMGSTFAGSRIRSPAHRGHCSPWATRRLGCTGRAGSVPSCAPGSRGPAPPACGLDYHRPNRLEDCTQDVLAGIQFLEGHGLERVVLLGWSFRGRSSDPTGLRSVRVVAVPTVGAQMAGTTRMIGRVAPRPLLM
jgi:hypothetical protein